MASRANLCASVQLEQRELCAVAAWSAAGLCFNQNADMAALTTTVNCIRDRFRSSES